MCCSISFSISAASRLRRGDDHAAGSRLLNVKQKKVLGDGLEAVQRIFVLWLSEILTIFIHTGKQWKSHGSDGQTRVEVVLLTTTKAEIKMDGAELYFRAHI